MKLLFLTQVIDSRDAVLGFVSRWIAGLARHADQVRVVALEAGDIADLPANVDVRVVGRRGVLRRYLRYRSILKEALVEDGFDTVLAHMVPRYALVAEGPARRAGAGLFLWYTHKGVDARLRRAVQRVDRVFTASRESLRVETPNRIETGHGIDLEHFHPSKGEPEAPARILSVGRLTPAKDPLTILAALSILVARGRDVYLDLVGAGLAAGDESYARTVRDQIESGGLQKRVSLHGEVAYPDIPLHYNRATVLVNASLTGSVDKVVLEAMASGRPVLSCNESFPPLFAELGARADSLTFAAGEAAELADRLEVLLDMSQADKQQLGQDLRSIVARDHEVDALMGKLCRLMAEHSGAGRR